MSRKSVIILRNTYDIYMDGRLDLRDLAKFLIQSFDWSRDNMVVIFKEKLKQGIKNQGIIQMDRPYCFSTWKLKTGFAILDSKIREYNDVSRACESI